MKATQALRLGIETSDMICNSYLDDLTDAELMHRPHEKANHIKWQMGHLIAADNEMVNGCIPGTLEDLPDGFADQYSKEKSASDAESEFHSKSELMELYGKQRAKILAALETLTDEDLEKPAPEKMAAYAPTLGAVLSMVGTHWMMHGGQWAVIRRQLGRAPIM